MGKKLFIAEKPSVAQEFARVLKVNGRRGDGFIESCRDMVCRPSRDDELSGKLRSCLCKMGV